MEKQEYQGYTGVWRRMKSGAAIFIRDGEDIKTAVRRNFNGDKATQKLREYDKKDYEAFEREQQSRSELNKALREKGELSEDYENALKRMKQAKADQNKIYNEKHDYINEMQDLARKQEQGLKIKKDEFDAIKKSGMTPKQKAEEIKKANSYTSQELKDKYGTDNVDLINAGKEKEDRVSLKQETSQTPKASTAKQMDYDAEVEKYYRTSSVDNISADLEDRKHRMEKDWYAPNDKETYQKWNEATEKYLGKRLSQESERLRNSTPKQKAAEIDKANKKIEYPYLVGAYDFEKLVEHYRGAFADGYEVEPYEKGTYISKETTSYHITEDDFNTLMEINKGVFEEPYIVDKSKLKANTNKFKAEVSKTPKQKAAAIDKANSKKEMTYEEFLEKQFGYQIDRMDLSEEDDDALYQEWLNLKKKK